MKAAYLYELVDIIDQENPHTIEVHGKTYKQVVRCKDCKWYYEKGALCGYWTDLCEHAEVYPRITPIDFCSRGERKDESTMGQLNSQEVINEVEKL